jgi:YkoP domain
MMAAMGPVRASIPARFLKWLIGATDATLRHVLGVTEFEQDADGLFRIELGRAAQDLRLSDGTVIRAGDVVVELHLWNEQLEPVPPAGADFGWAVRMRRKTLATLRRLARHIRDDRRLEDVRAIRMQPAVASRHPASLLDRLLPKIGFEPVGAAAPERAPLHLFLDNVWLWMLTWAHSPRSLKGRHFRRRRREFWISRQRLLALYDETEDQAG